MTSSCLILTLRLFTFKIKITVPYGLRHSTEQFQAQKYAPPRLPYGVFKKNLPCHQFLWCGDGNFGVVDGVVNGVVDYKSYHII